jgi:predicted TIM-barrel fold metal-dependent hydrolase
MADRTIGRRSFLQGAGLWVVSGVLPSEGLAQIAVPNSSGTELPRLKAPPLACDCHHHIYDTARFPAVQRPEPNARVAEYRLLQRRIGTSRDIVVTPSAYGTDNRVTLDAISQLGANARGVAVIHPTITDTELKALDRGGIRGIRFALNTTLNGNKAVTSLDMIEPLAKRVDELGWHVQLQTGADQIVSARDLWNRVPSVMVFDHMGHIPQPMGTKHPAFALICRLIDKGRTWVKLSVTYDNTKDGPPTYADVTKVAQAYVKAAPERMVWGSNWPHPNETIKPDDAVLFDLLAEWAPDETTRHRILVENPAELYGFRAGVPGFATGA